MIRVRIGISVLGFLIFLVLILPHSCGRENIEPLPASPSSSNLAKQFVYQPSLTGSPLPTFAENKSPLPTSRIKSVIVVAPRKTNSNTSARKPLLSPNEDKLILFQDERGRIYLPKGKAQYEVKQIYIKPRPLSISPQLTLQAAFIPNLSGSRIYIAPGLGFTLLRIKNLYIGLSIAGIKRADTFVYAAGPGGQVALGNFRVGLWYAVIRQNTAPLYFTVGVGVKL